MGRGEIGKKDKSKGHRKQKYGKGIGGGEMAQCNGKRGNREQEEGNRGRENRDMGIV